MTISVQGQVSCSTGALCWATARPIVSLVCMLLRHASYIRHEHTIIYSHNYISDLCDYYFLCFHERLRMIPCIVLNSFFVTWATLQWDCIACWLCHPVLQCSHSIYNAVVSCVRNYCRDISPRQQHNAWGLLAGYITISLIAGY